MILSCPSCDTRYVVDPAALGPTGRTVRCARCHATWAAKPPGLGPVAGAAKAEATTRPTLEPTPPPPVEPHLRIEAKPIPPGSNLPIVHPKAGRRRGRWLAATAGALALTSSVLAAAVVWREPIVDAWAPAALLYETLRLPVAPAGTGLVLAEEDLRLREATVDEARRLEIDGRIANGSDAPRDVPPLRLTLLDTGGQTLDSFDIRAEARSLGPGESARYHLSVPYVEGTARVRARFIRDDRAP